MLLQGFPVDVLGQATHEDRVGITSTAAAAAAGAIAATTARAIAATTGATAAATAATAASGFLAVLEVATTTGAIRARVLVPRIRARVGSRLGLLAATTIAAATIAATVAATRLLLLPTNLTAAALAARALDDVVQGPGRRIRA